MLSLVPHRDPHGQVGRVALHHLSAAAPRDIHNTIHSPARGDSACLNQCISGQGHLYRGKEEVPQVTKMKSATEHEITCTESERGPAIRLEGSLHRRRSDLEWKGHQ